MQLYSTDAAPFPALADVPASPSPVVASGPGDRVAWLLRGRRGEDGGDAGVDWGRDAGGSHDLLRPLVLRGVCCDTRSAGM